MTEGRARKRRYAKRGGNPVRISLTDVTLSSEQPGEEVLAIHQALKRLAELDPRKSQIVEPWQTDECCLVSWFV
jgi:hypothetical protein